MFEDYLVDASHFIESAKSDAGSDSRLKVRHYRVSIFLVASALEAFINYLGETFRDNHSLTLHERDFLNDLQTEVNPKTAELNARDRYQSLENKIKFLICRFSIDLQIANTPEWSHFKEFKMFRDDLVHPRAHASEFTSDEYRKHAERGLKSSIFIIDALMLGIFNRNLRQQVLDLAVL
jgi:hypothetical protein